MTFIAPDGHLRYPLWQILQSGEKHSLQQDLISANLSYTNLEKSE